MEGDIPLNDALGVVLTLLNLNPLLTILLIGLCSAGRGKLSGPWLCPCPLSLLIPPILRPGPAPCPGPNEVAGPKSVSIRDSLEAGTGAGAGAGGGREDKIGMDAFLCKELPMEVVFETVDLVVEDEIVGLEGIVRFDPRGLALGFNFELYEYTPPVGTAARFDSTFLALMFPPLGSLAALDVVIDVEVEVRLLKATGAGGLTSRRFNIDLLGNTLAFFIPPPPLSHPGPSPFVTLALVSSTEGKGSGALPRPIDVAVATTR